MDVQQQQFHMWRVRWEGHWDIRDKWSLQALTVALEASPPCTKHVTEVEEVTNQCFHPQGIQMNGNYKKVLFKNVLAKCFKCNMSVQHLLTITHMGVQEKVKGVTMILYLILSYCVLTLTWCSLSTKSAALNFPTHRNTHSHRPLYLSVSTAEAHVKHTQADKETFVNPIDTSCVLSSLKWKEAWS